MVIDHDGSWHNAHWEGNLRYRNGKLEVVVWSHPEHCYVWVLVPSEEAPGPDVIERVKGQPIND
jgi:hypothetical protein